MPRYTTPGTPARRLEDYLDACISGWVGTDIRGQGSYIPNSPGSIIQVLMADAIVSLHARLDRIEGLLGPKEENA